MRYFRIGVVILFIASVLFSGWARYKYDSNQNMDRPVLAAMAVYFGNTRLIDNTILGE